MKRAKLNTFSSSFSFSSAQKLLSSSSYEVPIIISSGYRSSVLNLKVGGAYASQHTMGEAADIHIPLNDYSDWDDNKRHTNMELAKQWFDFLEHHTDFDQLIIETSNGRDYWIHVSCQANRKKNRHQIFRDMRKK